ncbi:MAG: hypothetical protein MI919_13305 [Holophagales bacterium]|nr:hypothetical protein [Holophagales bacterium]
MRIAGLLIAVTLLLIAIAGALFAGGFLDGQWRLTMRATLPDNIVEGGADCTFRGSAEVTNIGTSVSGPATYQLVEGVDGCPEAFSGEITATFVGDNMVVGTLTGPLGTGTFDGWLFQPAGLSYFGFTGDFSLTQGAFAGTTGTWIGETGSLPPAIPALGTPGFLALLLLLLGAGILVLRR